VPRAASQDIDRHFQEMLFAKSIGVQFEGDRLELKAAKIPGDDVLTADEGVEITFLEDMTLGEESFPKGAQLTKDRSGWWARK
jgi:hypothetical protein